MNRKKRLLLLLILPLCLCLSGCGGDGKTKQSVEIDAISFVATQQTSAKGQTLPPTEQPQTLVSIVLPTEPVSAPAATEIPIVAEIIADRVEPTAVPIQPSPIPLQPTAVPTELPLTASLNLMPQSATEPAPVFGSPSVDLAPIPTQSEANPFDVAEPTAAPVEKTLYQPVIVNANATGANWQNLPVLPENLTQAAKDIYAYGTQKMGRKGNYFSKIGDCQSFANVFLGEYSYTGGSYTLDDSELYLENAITYFQDSFNAVSYAVANGLSAASALTTIWSDPYACQYGESALMCEIRINDPSILFVNLGTNWVVGADTSIYYDYLDEIVYKTIQQGVLPILSTKADNIEGDNKINEITAAIAEKYGVPLYNFWRQAQTLPNHGLDVSRDNIHLSVETWNVRSYWALKTLYAVGHSLGLF